MCYWGPWLVDVVGMGWCLGYMIFMIFSNLNDSVILKENTGSVMKFQEPQYCLSLVIMKLKFQFITDVSWPILWLIPLKIDLIRFLWNTSFFLLCSSSAYISYLARKECWKFVDQALRCCFCFGKLAVIALWNTPFPRALMLFLPLEIHIRSVLMEEKVLVLSPSAFSVV